LGHGGFHGIDRLKIISNYASRSQRVMLKIFCIFITAQQLKKWVTPILKVDALARSTQTLR
jgi:hypothetical protein